MILGTVAEYVAGDGISIIIDGEDTSTEKKYTFLASYSPQVNDRILIEEVGDSYVVLGKIADESSSNTSIKLRTGTTPNIVELVDGAGEVISSVTVNRVAQDSGGHTISSTYGAKLASGTTPNIVILQTPNGVQLSTVTVNRVAEATSLMNQAYSNHNFLIQFRNGGNTTNPTLQFRVGTGSWYTLAKA